MVYRIFIAPVGFYYRRILHHIRDFMPDKIYLLTQSGLEEEVHAKSEWSKITSENYEKIVSDLKGVYGKERVEKVPVDLRNYTEVFKIINGLVRKGLEAGMGREVEIRFDVTSAPLRVRVAMINLATFFKEIEVYHTPAKGEYSPEEYNPKWAEDEGEKPEQLPISRSVSFHALEKNEFYKEIISTINKQPNKTVESQNKLLELIGKSKSKSNAMRLSRRLDELESYGIVVRTRLNEKDKSVSLTLLGQAIAESLVTVS